MKPITYFKNGADFLKGQAAEKRGSLPLAADIYESALEHSKDPRILYALGKLYEENPLLNPEGEKRVKKLYREAASGLEEYGQAGDLYADNAYLDLEKRHKVPSHFWRDFQRWRTGNENPGNQRFSRSSKPLPLWAYFLPFYPLLGITIGLFIILHEQPENAWASYLILCGYLSSALTFIAVFPRYWGMVPAKLRILFRILSLVVSGLGLLFFFLPGEIYQAALKRLRRALSGLLADLFGHRLPFRRELDS